MVLKHFLVFILYCLAFVENKRVPALSKFYNKVQVDNELNHMLEAVISDQESTTTGLFRTQFLIYLHYLLGYNITVIY